MLREGADVNLRFSQSLTSKTAAEGDPVTLDLVDDLKVGDVIVAKAGSKAVGEVSNAKNLACWARLVISPSVSTT